MHHRKEVILNTHDKNTGAGSGTGVTNLYFKQLSLQVTAVTQRI